VLVSSDVGVNTTPKKITYKNRKRVAEDKYLGTEELNLIL
jgi:fused signal recognition particle receptor